jgi:hypothetical protein
VLLVNGRPTPGRTALARALGLELLLPVLSQDVLGQGAGGHALWRLLEASPAGAVIEAWFPKDSVPVVAAGLHRAGYRLGDVPQVVCAGPSQDQVQADAAPGSGPTTRVDTTSPVPAAVVTRLALWAHGGRTIGSAVRPPSPADYPAAESAAADHHARHNSGLFDP